MLREHIIRSIAESFPNRNFTLFDEANRIATLPMPNGLGDLSIFEDGDEITFYLGEITHCHFSQEYLGDNKYTPEEETVEEAIDFLRDLFTDRAVFYCARNGGRDGSIQCPTSEQISKITTDCDCYTWTNQIKTTTEQGGDGDSEPAV